MNADFLRILNKNTNLIFNETQELNHHYNKQNNLMLPL